MFLRLLIESFTRQKRRKLLAGIAILLGTTAVTAMLALATSIGDRIHRELAVYGANIIVTPKASNLEVKVGDVNIQPATGNAYLKESDLEKLKTIFWANNITALSPEFAVPLNVLGAPSFALSAKGGVSFAKANDRTPPKPVRIQTVGAWFNQPFGNLKTGLPALHPSWKLTGTWPRHISPSTTDSRDAVVTQPLADRLNLKLGDRIYASPDAAQFSSKTGILEWLIISGIVDTGDNTNNRIFMQLSDLQELTQSPNAVSRVEISARTRPEDAFARQNPDTLSPAQHDLWYCRPYANSIAYQIREAIPGADATQVRRVEQTEGTLLSRISGLMWLVSAAALFAAGFAVSAAMATAVMERRAEIGLMRSLGASRGAIAALFYAESSLLALAGGILGYFAGSLLAWWLGARIFPSDGASPILNFVLLPVVVAMAVVVAILGSTPAIRSGLRAEVANILRGDQ